MSKKTITKFSIFVISAIATSGCGYISSPEIPAVASPRFGPPAVVGTIRSKEITESSGIAASRCQSDVLWTHNDSGDDAFIYAINAKGDPLGTWMVEGARNADWEDIATFKDRTGKCFVYIAETGNNKLKRPDHIVYRIIEPTVGPDDASSSRTKPLDTSTAESLRFIYPDFDQDAETLLVHPETGVIYVVTKRVSGPAGVYRVRSEFSSPDTPKAESVGKLSVPAIPNGFLTGGDISPDGRYLIVCDYTRAYEYELPSNAGDFGVIWSQEPTTIELGSRKVGEAICYSHDGTSLFSTSEGEGSPLIEVRRK